MIASDAWNEIRDAFASRKCGAPTFYKPIHVLSQSIIYARGSVMHGGFGPSQKQSYHHGVGDPGRKLRPGSPEATLSLDGRGGTIARDQSFIYWTQTSSFWRAMHDHTA
jgi:hypothetical protein